jgi:cyclase
MRIVCFTAIVVALVRTSAPTERHFETVTIADGVYAFIAETDRLDFVDGNSTLIVGRDSALVVDTNDSPESARAVLVEVRRLTDKPVRFVVTTHWHYDHWLGNQVYADAYPGAVFIAHAETDRVLGTWGAYFPERLRRTLPASQERLERQLATGKDGDRQLTPFERRLAQDQLASLPATQRMLAEIHIVRPTTLFTDRIVLNLGSRDVEVLHLGRGNTPGDAVIWMPRERVLLTGDLLVAPTPFGLNSFPASWLTVLRRLATFNAAVIVPGHGPVQRDSRYLEQVTELLAFVVDGVRQATREAKTLEETRQAVGLDSFRMRFAGENEVRSYMFDTFWTRPIIERAWREARGEF